MIFKRISSNLIMCDIPTFNTSFIFECAKSFLNNGFHVHYISKSKVEEIPFSIHGGIKPTVDAFSRLTLKYIENVDQLIEYACGLQFIQSYQGKYPKVIILQDFEVYLKDESKGALVTAMILDALNALSKAFNSPTYLLAGLNTSSTTTAIRTLPSIIDNFFSSVWKMTIKSDGGVGSLRKLPVNEFQNQTKEIKFRIGQDNVLFLENICEHFEI